MKRKLVKVLGLSYSQSQTGSYVLILAENKGKGKLPVIIKPNEAQRIALEAEGIKVSRHCTYHGVALNAAMDLSPFSRIDPCGYPSLQTVDLSTIGVSVSWQEAADVLGQKLTTYLSP